MRDFWKWLNHPETHDLYLPMFMSGVAVLVLGLLVLLAVFTHPVTMLLTPIIGLIAAPVIAYLRR